MDTISLIIAALIAGATAGATAGAQSVTTDAMKDAYTSLKEMLKRHFNSRPEGQTALEQHEKNPEVWESPLRTVLTETKVSEDTSIVKMAEKLLELANQNNPQLTQTIIGKVVGQVNAPGGKVTIVGGDVNKIDM